jgi:uncharacterized repeat protein (TIGR03803 family)
MHMGKITATGLTLFSIGVAPVAANASKFKTLHTYNREDGDGSALQILFHAGKIYGTAEYKTHGEVFRLNPRNKKYETVFSQSGVQPYNIVDHGDVLYGTVFGQTGGCECGALFQLDPVSGAESVLYTFTGGVNGYHPMSLIYYKGSLLGDTEPEANVGEPEVIFQFDLAANNYSILHTFAANDSTYDFIPVGGRIYGISGATQDGSIFRLGEKTDRYRIQYSFQGGQDGSIPNGLVLQGNMLYGTTTYGGATNSGTIFTFDPETRTERVLYSFQGGSDGWEPVGPMVYINGKFYGATYIGGDMTKCLSNGCGTLFQYDPATGTHKVLYSFENAADGSSPYGLITDGTNVYGSTEFEQDNATIFEYDP